jgi:hypothetical protein
MTPATQAANFINNCWTAPAAGGTIPVFDPSDGGIFAYLARGNATDIEAAVRAARTAYDGGDGPWGRFSALERGRLMIKLAQAIADHTDELAMLECRDTGKPMKQARADAIAFARYFEYYAGACDKLHGETLPYQRGYTVMTIREAHGVTGHIIPWNYPMQIFGRSVGASLAAGNACVVKPAEDACLSLLKFAELAAAAGLPPGGAQHRHWFWPRGRRSAFSPPGHRPHLLHRIAGHRQPGRTSRCHQPSPGYPGTGRQVAATGVRRCRPRRGVAGTGGGHHPERRADLQRGQPRAGRTIHP